MLSVTYKHFMLSIVMLNIVMLNVVAPLESGTTFMRTAWSRMTM